MTVKTFRRSIANTVIILVIVAVSIISFGGSSVVTSSAGSAPIYSVKDSNCVSLMVNIYWGEEYLDDMLDIFERNGVKTTFFVGGCWAEKNEEMLKKIYSKGHEIGNHGYFHKDHKKIGAQRNREEISANHSLVKSILGIEMRLFSPPSASFSSVTLDVAEKMGYTTIMYSRDTIDWRDHDSKLIFSRATKNIKGGELVLMHPTAATVAALENIIVEIKSKNLHLTTVSEVIGYANNIQ